MPSGTPARRWDARGTLRICQTLADIVAVGPDEFGPDDAATVLSGAANAVEVFTSGDCDGFTRP